MNKRLLEALWNEKTRKYDDLDCEEKVEKTGRKDVGDKKNNKWEVRC